MHTNNKQLSGRLHQLVLLLLLVLAGLRVAMPALHHHEEHHHTQHHTTGAATCELQDHCALCSFLVTTWDEPIVVELPLLVRGLNQEITATSPCVLLGALYLSPFLRAPPLA